jgi:rod shape-determining protein MreB
MKASEGLPGAQFTKEMIKTIKEQHRPSRTTRRRSIVELPVEGKPTKFEVTDALRESCRQIIPPIVEGLGKLVATFDPEFQHRLKNRVLLAGGEARSRGSTSRSRPR